MSAKLTIPARILSDLHELMMDEIGKVLPRDESGRIIVYGAGARGAVINVALRSLGRSIAYFIDSNPAKHGTTAWGIPVHGPDRLAGECPGETFVIVASDYPSDMLKTIEGYGFRNESNAAALFDRFSIFEGTPYTAPLPLLDFALGYNRLSDLPGFKCMGTPSASAPGALPLRILVLGNSTTDPEVADPLNWRIPDLREQSLGSWPRHLHELLAANGIEHLIFNGAISAYTSAQEAVKLLRDGLSLAPHLVIACDGINDTGCTYWHDQRHPKTHSFLARLDSALTPALTDRRIQIGTIESTASIEGISYGLATDKSPIGEWHANQRIMKAICAEFDIDFISFLQPGGLYLSDYLQSCEVRIRLHWLVSNLFISWRHLTAHYEAKHRGSQLADLPLRDLLDFYLTCAFGYDAEAGRFRAKEDVNDAFYRQARKIAFETDYIVDISETLYGHPEAFYDGCHCTDLGNRLIAERVFRELVSRNMLRMTMGKIARVNNG